MRNPAFRTEAHLRCVSKWKAQTRLQLFCWISFVAHWLLTIRRRSRHRRPSPARESTRRCAWSNPPSAPEEGVPKRGALRTAKSTRGCPERRTGRRECRTWVCRSNPTISWRWVGCTAFRVRYGRHYPDLCCCCDFSVTLLRYACIVVGDQDKLGWLVCWIRMDCKVLPPQNDV